MPTFEVELQQGLKHAVITTSGPDRPGVSAAFFTVLANHGVQLLDVSQVDFRGRLMLSTFVGMDPLKLTDLERELRAGLWEFGQRVTIETGGEARSVSRPRSTHVIVMLGNPVQAEQVSRLGATLAGFGANIDRINGISNYPVTGLEFLSLIHI